MAEKIALEIGNLSKNLVYLGQSYQDPRDALNEFVSNAADEYKKAGMAGAVIMIELRRYGKSTYLRVSDAGNGMTKAKLTKVAKQLCESDKADDERTIGEKGIGILGFAQLGRRCDIVSRAEASDVTWCLSLERGNTDASLGVETQRKRRLPGTDVYIYDIDQPVLRLLSPTRLSEYFKQRRRQALARGEYQLEIREGKDRISVKPQRFTGEPFVLLSAKTPHGPVEFNLYILPPGKGWHRVALVGRGGTTILEDASELEEFGTFPWNSDQVDGEITFGALQQSTGRKSVIRDEQKFPVFLDAVKAVEDKVAEETRRLARVLDEKTESKLLTVLRDVWSRVLRELRDLDNPMRTPVVSKTGEEGPGGPTAVSGESEGGDNEGGGHGPQPHRPAVDPTLPTTSQQRFRSLPNLLPDTLPNEYRSRFQDGIIFYNDQHPDYLSVKSDSISKLHYLMTIIAKEYVLYNNPGASPLMVSEDMIRLVTRARKHLPARL